MSVLIKVCISVILSVYISNACAQKLRKNTYESVPKLISSSGYPVERHRVVTEDGYILQMHRIPAGRRTPRRTSPAGKGKRAVLVIHGLFGSSGDFIIMGSQRSLGYLLADAGYDVWLGNLRGNYYTSHQNLTRNNPDFWEFSFHEHGKLDIPVMIDHILNVTGLQKVTYVGYSMGTTSFFTMMAQRPEYNDKVTSFFALAPAVYLDNIKQLALLLLKTVDVPKTMQSRGMISATLQPELIKFLVENVCNFKYPQQDMCSSIIFSIVGEDYEQNDLEMQSTIISRMQPASWRQLQHFGKIAITGEFTSWEDGLWGRVRPYNLNNVKVPVTLLYGENDQLTDKHQIMRLAETLKRNGMLEEMRPGCSWPKFNHLDFVFAKDVGKLLNKPLIKLIDNMYNKYYSDSYVCVLFTDC